jgi:hypothetical protein
VAGRGEPVVLVAGRPLHEPGNRGNGPWVIPGAMSGVVRGNLTVKRGLGVAVGG